jgi:hypothetical protein
MGRSCKELAWILGSVPHPLGAGAATDWIGADWALGL